MRNVHDTAKIIEMFETYLGSVTSLKHLVRIYQKMPDSPQKLKLTQLVMKKVYKYLMSFEQYQTELVRKRGDR